MEKSTAPWVALDLFVFPNSNQGWTFEFSFKSSFLNHLNEDRVEKDVVDL